MFKYVNIWWSSGCLTFWNCSDEASSELKLLQADDVISILQLRQPILLTDCHLIATTQTMLFEFLQYHTGRIFFAVDPGPQWLIPSTKDIICIIQALQSRHFLNNTVISLSLNSHLLELFPINDPVTILVKLFKCCYHLLFARCL